MAGEDRAELISAYIAREYNLGETVDCSLLRNGHLKSQTYEIRTLDAKYIFRVYGPYWTERPEQARFELDWLTALRAKGISVSAPAPGRDGQRLASLDLPEGARYGALFTYAEGSVSYPLSEAQGFMFGANFANLHLASGEFLPCSACRVYDAAALVDIPIAQMKPYLEGDLTAWNFLRQAGTQLRDRISTVPKSGDVWGPIHGDIHQGNLHWMPNAAPILFDFAVCGVGWRVYDLAGMLWPLRDGTADDPAVRVMCDSVLAGYESVRPLTPAEQFALPAFVKARDLWETGTFLESDKPELPIGKEAIMCVLNTYRAHPTFLTTEG